MKELCNERGIEVTGEEAADVLGRVMRYLYLTSDLSEEITEKPSVPIDTD